jgi:hypothetical protein
MAVWFATFVYRRPDISALTPNGSTIVSVEMFN